MFAASASSGELQPVISEEISVRGFILSADIACYQWLVIGMPACTTKRIYRACYSSGALLVI